MSSASDTMSSQSDEAGYLVVWSRIDPDSLPEDERSCAICLEPYEDCLEPVKPSDTGEYPIGVQCGHVFGNECISAWINSDVNEEEDKTCRTCRGNLHRVPHVSHYYWSQYTEALFDDHLPNRPQRPWHNTRLRLPIGVTNCLASYRTMLKDEKESRMFLTLLEDAMIDEDVRIDEAGFAKQLRIVSATHWRRNWKYQCGTLRDVTRLYHSFEKWFQKNDGKYTTVLAACQYLFRIVKESCIAKNLGVERQLVNDIYDIVLEFCSSLAKDFTVDEDNELAAHILEELADEEEAHEEDEQREELHEQTAQEGMARGIEALGGKAHRGEVQGGKSHKVETGKEGAHEKDAHERDRNDAVAHAQSGHANMTDVAITKDAAIMTDALEAAEEGASTKSVNDGGLSSTACASVSATQGAGSGLSVTSEALSVTGDGHKETNYEETGHEAEAYEKVILWIVASVEECLQLY